MVIHNQSCCFFSFPQFLRFNIVTNMNLIIPNPPSSQHPIKRIFSSHINPPNKINSTLSYPPFNYLRRSSLDQSFIFFDLFSQFVCTKHVMRFNISNCLTEGNSLIVGIGIIYENAVRIFVNLFLDQLNYYFLSDWFSTETWLNKFLGLFWYLNSFFFQILPVFYFLLNNFINTNHIKFIFLFYVPSQKVFPCIIKSHQRNQQFLTWRLNLTWFIGSI